MRNGFHINGHNGIVVITLDYFFKSSDRFGIRNNFSKLYRIKSGTACKGRFGYFGHSAGNHDTCKSGTACKGILTYDLYACTAYVFIELGVICDLVFNRIALVRFNCLNLGAVINFGILDIFCKLYVGKSDTAEECFFLNNRHATGDGDAHKSGTTLERRCSKIAESSRTGKRGFVIRFILFTVALKKHANDCSISYDINI